MEKRFLRKLFLHIFSISIMNPLYCDYRSEKLLPEGRLDATLNAEVSNISMTGSPNDNTNNYVTYNTELSTELIWTDLLIYGQLGLVLLGLLANVGTLITLCINANVFSPAILILLRHQSASDATACLFSLILTVQPAKPILSGIYFIDVFICHVWFSQTMFWNSFNLSIWNLVLLACERYLAVCHPFKYKELTPKRVHLMIFGIYLLIAAVHWPAYYLFVKLSEGICVFLSIEGESGALLKSQNVFAICTFVVFYFIPCTLFVVLYGLVILTFYARQKQSNLSTSRVIDKATSELTKTAIVVTLIFIITLGLNRWYFLLGVFGAIHIVVYSPIHMVSLWLCSLNSAANPFVYCLLMPVYRKSVKNTFCISAELQ